MTKNELKKEIHDLGYNYNTSHLKKAELELVLELLVEGYQKENVGKIIETKLQGFEINEALNKEFNFNQLIEIITGIKKRIDVSKYSDYRFDAGQMSIIRFGLEKGLDVSLYADIKFSSGQMNCLEHGLSNNIDISSYLNEDLDVQAMEVIYKKLINEANEDIESVLGVDKVSFSGLNDLRFARSRGYNLELYKGLQSAQINQVNDGFNSSIDASIYSDERFDSLQMEEIKEGLIEGVDVSLYADPKFKDSQMEEIKLGLMDKIDVSAYLNNEFHQEKMRTIRHALIHGFSEITKYVSFDTPKLSGILYGLTHGLDISKYAKECYTFEQMKSIIKGLENNLNVDLYLDANIKEGSMYYIVDSLIKKTFKRSDWFDFDYKLNKFVIKDEFKIEDC